MKAISMAVLAALLLCTAALAQERGTGIRLHQAMNGKELYVNPRAVAFVRIPIGDEPGKAVIVFANGGKQALAETMKEVIDLIAAEKFIVAPFPGECR